MEGPDPVVLSVSQIRQRIFEVTREVTSAGTVEDTAVPTGSAAGRLFHLCAASVVDRRSGTHWEQVLGEEDNAIRLADAVYDIVLGPELVRCRSAVTGEQLLLVWNAVRAFSVWFAKLIERARQRGVIRFDPKREVWEGSTELFVGEFEVIQQFHEAGWRAPVRISGVADQVIRAGEKRWCVVEFKLGTGHPEADTLQACLYHEILGSKESVKSGTAAAVVRFGDGGPEEFLIQGHQIVKARSALMNLIGEMAGVLGGSPPPRPRIAQQAVTWPKSPVQTEEDLGRRIVKTLIEFKADARPSGQPIVGPAFVRFFVQPEHGVATSKILGQGANLQVRLGVSSEPVIHMVEGRIAIDVARPIREAVLFRHLEERIPRGEDGNSHALVGIDLSGNMVFLDFAAPEHAHVLVAGVAGSGKSEWLRTALASLVVTNKPETLRLVLIDPKRNAFLDLKDSPFLLAPGALLHPPLDDVMPVLAELIEEMERRSQLFEQVRADNLADYRRKTQAALPRIIVACDEFADLVMASKQQRAAVELVLNRLGQKARAAGIHLVIATQSPRREVVSGILRANTPARVALRVTTAVESRLILDRGGAEKLLGRGDLLFASNHDPIRLQAPYLPDEDRLAIFGRLAKRTVGRSSGR